MTSSSGARILKGLALAVPIMVICLLPPGVHFVTGPLSPAIAGYVAGSRYRYSAGEAALFGCAIGVAMATGVFVAFEWVEGFPALQMAAVTLFAVVSALYVGALAGIAAHLSAKRV
jgi:hypothetical protein